MDISAGFDTFPHIYLLQKHTGLDGQLPDRKEIASYSEFWEVIKGVPQEGTSAPSLFGDYTVDIQMATCRCIEWEEGEAEDRQRLQQAIESGKHTYWKKDTGKREYKRGGMA